MKDRDVSAVLRMSLLISEIDGTTKKMLEMKLTERQKLMVTNMRQTMQALARDIRDPDTSPL